MIQPSLNIIQLQNVSSYITQPRNYMIHSCSNMKQQLKYIIKLLSCNMQQLWYIIQHSIYIIQVSSNMIHPPNYIS